MHFVRVTVAGTVQALHLIPYHLYKLYQFSDLKAIESKNKRAKK